MNLIEVKELRKKYGSHEVLQGINLEVRKKGILAVIGPNGAGKSTFLRLLNLVDRPDSGKIIFEGVDTEGSDSKPLLEIRRRIGAVLQSPVLFRGSVFHNVNYGLNLRSIVDGKAGPKALKRVGLSGFEEREVSGLSGGECQRVALARAIAFEPDLLLLDEPAADTDEKNAELVEKVIVEMGKKIAVVLSTHDLAQARRIAGRVARMEAGKIVECGKTRGVL